MTSCDICHVFDASLFHRRFVLYAPCTGAFSAHAITGGAAEPQAAHAVSTPHIVNVILATFRGLFVAETISMGAFCAP